jgi:hypothetical protein
MVRHPFWRRKKYEAKVSGTVAELRVDAYGSSMASLHEAMATVLVSKEEQAKTEILEPAGVTTCEMPFYLNAMREFCKASRNFTSTSRDNKCYDVLCGYRDKGLDVALLYKLAMLCECYPIGYGYY